MQPEKKRSSGNHPVARRECPMDVCPHAELISILNENLDEIRRRLAVIDGNGLDKTGGSVGRLMTKQSGHDEFLDKLKIAIWIMFGMLIAQGGASLVLFRSLIEISKLAK